MTLEQQLIELIEKFAPAIRDAFLAGIRDLTDNAILAQVIQMVERNDVEGALRALGLDMSVFNPLRAQITALFEQGGILLMSTMPKYTKDDAGVKNMLRFNIRDQRAEQWLADKSSELIVGIEQDIRDTVRTTLSDGMSAGRNPRTVALDIVGRYNQQTGHREGGVVGLGAREEAWARSVRLKLETLDQTYFDMELRDKRFDATVEAAIRSGKPLSADVVQKLVDRYRDRALKHRGDMIGRTEALAALNRSEYESTLQALRQSGLPLSAAMKEWDSTGDSRVRPSHKLLDGRRVQIDQPFTSELGSKMLHPGDVTLGAAPRDVIGCRCRVKYIIDFDYGVA